MKCFNFFIVFLLALPKLYAQPVLHQKWVSGRIAVKPEVARNAIFTVMDKKRDFEEFILTDTPGVKSTSVSYRNSRSNIKEKIDVNCKTYLRSDTLIINIGAGDMFTSMGFMINCSEGFFYIEPYYTTDTTSEGDEEPPTKFKIFYQQVVLDKPVYRLGDRVHGYVKFKIIEQNGYETVTHIARGYFRGKLLVPNF